MDSQLLLVIILWLVTTVMGSEDKKVRSLFRCLSQKEALEAENDRQKQSVERCKKGLQVALNKNAIPEVGKRMMADQAANDRENMKDQNERILQDVLRACRDASMNCSQASQASRPGQPCDVSSLKDGQEQLLTSTLKLQSDLAGCRTQLDQIKDAVGRCSEHAVNGRQEDRLPAVIDAQGTLSSNSWTSISGLAQEITKDCRNLVEEKRLVDEKHLLALLTGAIGSVVVFGVPLLCWLKCRKEPTSG